MKLTFLIFITLLAVMIPLLWITGVLTSIVYFYRHRVSATREERTVALNPQLGLTMADGGDPLDEEKKESEAVKPVGVTKAPPGSPEQNTLQPAGGKMFWWGGY